MNHGTKQRIVGTVVLLMLALIFLPFILDGDGDYQPAITGRIPEMPAVEIMREPVPQRPQIDADRYPRTQPPAMTVLTDRPAVTAQDEPEPRQLVENSVVEPRPEPEPQSEPEPEPEPGPMLDEMSLPAGWSVRLGVFSNPQNAATLESRLLNAGYKAYRRELSGAQGSVTGVFVGPQVEREAANRLKVQLQEEFQLAGLVVRFEVEPL
ncbi:MAG: SPOR domain-containing protein [Gammaproteobacteria bacterium]